jgi:hypothetical protein
MEQHRLVVQEDPDREAFVLFSEVAESCDGSLVGDRVYAHHEVERADLEQAAECVIGQQRSYAVGAGEGDHRSAPLGAAGLVQEHLEQVAGGAPRDL